MCIQIDLLLKLCTSMHVDLCRHRPRNLATLELRFRGNTVHAQTDHFTPCTYAWSKYTGGFIPRRGHVAYPKPYMYKLIILPLAHVHGVNTLVVPSLGGDMLLILNLRTQTLFPIPHMKLIHVFKYMGITYPSHVIHMIGIIYIFCSVGLA